MSSRKFVPYENKRENAGRKNDLGTRFSQFPSGSSKRNVFPQFSEPEEYAFAGPNPSSFHKATNFSCQKMSNFPFNKTWNSFQPHPSLQRDNFMAALPLYQPLPTFRQYLNEENSESLELQNSISCASKVNQQRQPFVIKENSSLQLNTNNDEQNSIKSLGVKNQRVLIGKRFRHVIGTVDQVTRWHMLAKHSELEIHYEIAGILDSAIKKGGMQLLFIRSESGHVLQGVFYSIDRELPTFPSGTLITATGDMIGSNKMHIFDANIISKEDFIAVQRLAFLSQRAIEKSF